MSEHPRRSAALLVVAVALVIAFAGTAIAGPGATVSKKHKKKKPTSDAKADRKLFSSLLKAAAPKLSVSHAGTADSLNGVTVTRFFGNVPSGTTNQTVGSAGPVTIVASCTGGRPSIGFKATEAVNNMDYTDGGSPSGNAQLPAGTTDTIAGGASVQFGGMGETKLVTYTSHRTVKIDWFVRDTNSLGSGTGCFATGFITVG